MSHAVMPLADYVGACDAIREKTGGTEPITSGELVEQIGAVHTAGKLAALESAEVLKGKLFGNPVTATAVTPITHNTGARLESKNLFEYVPGAHNSYQYVTLVEQLDNGVIMRGSYLEANANNATVWSAGWYCPAPSYVDFETVKSYFPFVRAGDTVTLSLDYTVTEFHENRTGDEVIAFSMVLFDEDGNRTTKEFLYWNGVQKDATVRLTATHTMSTNCYVAFFVSLNSNTVRIENMQIEYGTEATPYTPYVSDFTKVRTRNLFNEELYTDYSHSDDGITVDYEGSGIFHVHGSATESGFSTKNLYFAIPVSEGDTFTESVEYLSGSTEIPMYMFFGTSATKGNASNWMNCQINASTVVGNTVTRTSTIPSGANYITAFWFYTTASSGAVDIRVRVQLEEGTEATPYVPYTIPAVVTKRGKNSIPYPYLTTTQTVNGVTFTDNGDGSITVKGTATASAYFNLCQIDFGVAETFTNNYVVTDCQYDDGNKYTYIGVRNGVTVDKTYYPQIEYGQIATPYEPYIPPVTYPADAEGNLGEVPSISPTMILECPDVEGVNIVAHYLKDIDGAFEERLADLEAAIVENA